MKAVNQNVYFGGRDASGASNSLSPTPDGGEDSVGESAHGLSRGFRLNPKSR
jgi:hypothetical protein